MDCAILTYDTIIIMFSTTTKGYDESVNINLQVVITMELTEVMIIFNHISYETR